MEDLHNIGPHYEKTLMAWHENFQKAWTMLKKRYDEKFKRMWDYYLLSFGRRIPCKEHSNLAACLNKIWHSPTFVEIEGDISDRLLPVLR